MIIFFVVYSDGHMIGLFVPIHQWLFLISKSHFEGATVFLGPNTKLDLTHEPFMESIIWTSSSMHAFKKESTASALK